MAKKTNAPEKQPTAAAAEQRVEGGEIHFTPGIPAEVKEIVSRTGSRGELTQVMCLVLDGRDKNKAIRRNVKGPVQIGDVLMLLETEIEAQRLSGGRRSGNSKS
ncbi:30S ribosomal protein S28e [Candidatus Woesearchaeota archaeon]|nr:30S ribosomal protein S28e [Candidatus Woesearchaeota archaeon]